MGSKNTLVSIAMTIYNGERFLAQQLDSIISQTFQNIEVVICDDGSTDQTLNIIRMYSQKHPFIHLYQNSERLGFIKNFEKAIHLCKGDYIALSDQDDIWMPEKLEKQIEYIQAEEKIHPDTPMMVHSDLEMIDAEGKRIKHSYFDYKKYKFKASKDLGQILGPCGVMGNTILFNKALKKKIIPIPDIAEFHDYWIAVINELFGCRITIDQPLVRYRIHHHNVSNTGKKLISHRFSLQHFTDFIQSKMIPPFLVSRKSEVIRHILQMYRVKEEDRLIMQDFLTYLEGRGDKIGDIHILLKHSLLKRNWIYRIRVIINYLFFYHRNTTLKTGADNVR